MGARQCAALPLPLPPTLDCCFLWFFGVQVYSTSCMLAAYAVLLVVSARNWCSGGWEFHAVGRILLTHSVCAARFTKGGSSQSGGACIYMGFSSMIKTCFFTIWEWFFLKLFSVHARASTHTNPFVFRHSKPFLCGGGRGQLEGCGDF